MKKILLLAKDIGFAKKISSIIDRNRYILMEDSGSSQNIFSFCLNIGADVILIHSSFLGNYTIFDQLFYLLNDLKYYCINEIIELMLRDIDFISSLEAERDRYKDAVEEEKWIKKAKVMLLKKGYTEAEAYKFILKKSMDERITKKIAAKKIIEEEGV